MVNKIKYFKDKPVLAEIIDLIIICIIALMIGKLLITYIILTGYVPSGSMETTIMTGDRILADRMAYWNAEPERGDIVVFYAPDKKAAGITEYYVKRVIGLPGETILIKDGNVYIDGMRLEEPYLRDGATNDGDSEEYTVPEGCYFMMGDNRYGSEDSRFWDHKFVPKEDICGKVFLKFSLRLNNFHFKIIKSYDDYSI